MTLSTKKPNHTVSEWYSDLTIQSRMTNLKYIFVLNFLITTSMLLPAKSLEIEPIPLPETLEGVWIFSTEIQSFKIKFLNEKLPKANGYRIETPVQEGPLLSVVAWRPYSDGISLIDEQGSTIIFFSRRKDGYHSTKSGKKEFGLERESDQLP